MSAMMACFLMLLTPIPCPAGGSSSPEEVARFRSEWQKVQENIEREIRNNPRPGAEVDEKGRGLTAEQATRAEKITKDAVAVTKGYLKGGGKGQGLAQRAERAASQPQALAEMYKAQDEALDTVSSEWETVRS